MSESLAPPSIRRRLGKDNILGSGSTCDVYQLTSRIVVKVPSSFYPGANTPEDPWDHDPAEDPPAEESRFLESIKHEPLSPHVIQAFLWFSDAIFLPIYSNGTVDDRLRANLTSDANGKIISIRPEPPHLIERWAAGLSAGVAWLENLGLFHGDLLTPNLILDDMEHVKLIDFDGTRDIKGEWHSIGDPPLKPPPLHEKGEWMGPRITQFTIGSMIYEMSRGKEAWDEREVDLTQDQRNDLVRLGRFPPLGKGTVDRIIRRCWHGRYKTIADLAEATMKLPGYTDCLRPSVISEAEMSELRKDCLEMVNEDLGVR